MTPAAPTPPALPATALDAVIDVSHHNGAIDWPAVAAAGIALVFVKATQGERFVDPVFARHRRAATAAGLLVVPYHYLDGADPSAQAAHFVTVAGLAAGDAAMLDWESAAPAQALVACGTAVTTCTGRDPLAYYGWAQLPAADPVLGRWPLMLPSYPKGEAAGDYRSLVARPPRLPPGRAASWQAGRPYDFHQYTPAGRVGGIAGPVDRSVWVGSGAELATWFATGALPAPAVPPPPVA
jgi:lysozyme